MNRLILTTACATASLGLAACGYDKDEYNEQAGYNAEQSNYTDSGANYQAPANDINATDMNDMNGSDEGNAASNETTGNDTGY
jgi:hypothetical protein